MNQLYNQVSGHIVGYIGFITNDMANYLIAVISYNENQTDCCMQVLAIQSKSP